MGSMINAADLNRASRIAVVVATKGRPQTLAELLRQLELQTLPPCVVIVSATCTADIEPRIATTLPLEYMFGEAGSSCQRNRALDKLGADIDTVAFFDDDFAPAATWLENCARMLRVVPDVVGASGILMRDGVKTGYVSMLECTQLLAAAPSTPDAAISDCEDLYGCNMAFRFSAVRNLRFDERLVLYGWMEDKDYSRSAGRNGRIVICAGLVGVHRGIRSARTSGRRYGYSQVVNPWYLYQKGTMTSKEAWSNILKALCVNGLKVFWPERHIDRFGRLAGNLIGAGWLLRGSCLPEKAAEL